MLVEFLSCDDSIKKLTAIAELHDNVDITVVDKRLVEFYYVRMVD